MDAQPPQPPPAVVSALASVKGLVSIVMGLALTHTIVTLVSSDSGSDQVQSAGSEALPSIHALSQIPPQSILCAVAVITAIVRFYHGNSQHLDLLYGKSSADLEGSGAKDGLGINFIVVMVQSVFFALMSFYVDGSRELLLLFSLLLLLDILWLLANLTAADAETLRHQVKWACNNVFFMALIFTLYNFKEDWAITAGAAAILVNTVIDFWISWEFYFPSLIGGDGSDATL